MLKSYWIEFFFWNSESYLCLFSIISTKLLFFFLSATTRSAVSTQQESSRETSKEGGEPLPCSCTSPAWACGQAGLSTAAEGVFTTGRGLAYSATSNKSFWSSCSWEGQARVGCAGGKWPRQAWCVRHLVMDWPKQGIGKFKKYIYAQKNTYCLLLKIQTVACWRKEMVTDMSCSNQGKLM